MLSEAELASFAAALFSMMNPIGNVGVFAGMTADRRRADATQTAWTCAVAVMITLLVVAWGGSTILKLFGITVDSLRAAGGLVVLLIGLHMLFNKSDHKLTPGEMADGEERESIAVVPLAIPMVAGPGTMATVLVASQQAPTVLSKVEISIVIVVMAIFTGALFSFAKPIAERLGKSGIGVVTRVMGLILAAIAMGMLTDGLKAMLPGLGG